MGRKRLRRSPGEGGIEELKSGSFRATWKGHDANGSPVRERRTFAEIDDARRWLAGKKLAGAVARPGTLNEWLTTWLELHAARVGPGGLRNDRQIVERYIRPALGGLKLSDLDSLRIERWLAGMLAAGERQGNRSKAGKVLRNALNAAVRSGVLPTNPMHGRVRVPSMPKAKTRSLNPEEFGRLLTAADMLEHGAMFRLWVELGLRPGELLGLHWEDYQPADGTVQIVRTVELTRNEPKPPKTSRDGRLPLSADTRARVEAYRAGRVEDVMFPGPKGGYYLAVTFLRKVWWPVLKAAGLPRVTRYIMRHTCASLLLNRGVNIVVIAKRLGHADPAMTLKTYSHLMPDDQSKASAIWSEILAGPAGPRPAHDTLKHL